MFRAYTAIYAGWVQHFVFLQSTIRYRAADIFLDGRHVRLPDRGSLAKDQDNASALAIIDSRLYLLSARRRNE
jgi:hypothetical protein